MLQLFNNSIIFTLLEFGYTQTLRRTVRGGKVKGKKNERKRKSEWGEENEKDNFFGSYIRQCLPVTKSMVNREAASYQLKNISKTQRECKNGFQHFYLLATFLQIITFSNNILNHSCIDY